MSMKELYSVRMRAAAGGPHEEGGRHISGAERLVPEGDVRQVVGAMLDRALNHSRGRPDFINLTLEALPAERVLTVPLLPIRTLAVPDLVAGRRAALNLLIKAGVVRCAAERALTALQALPDSMRGAMLLSAATGERLDGYGGRGVRVTRMDIHPASRLAVREALTSYGLGNNHVLEAGILASKVVSAPGVVAELCWSDDPDYVAGYVAIATCYTRFSYLKPYGSPIGGRAFFVREGTDINATISYLQEQPVLVVPGEDWCVVPEAGEARWNF